MTPAARVRWAVMFACMWAASILFVVGLAVSEWK
jgi:hypothetical protein